jgi:hypothetical protein
VARDHPRITRPARRVDTKKIVNGQLVDLTPEELQIATSEAAPPAGYAIVGALGVAGAS